MSRAIVRISLLCSLVSGCNSCQSSAPPPPVAAPAAAPKTTLKTIGTLDPVGRLGSDGEKTLKAAFKALRQKSYDDARGKFGQVVQGAPDYTAARYQELRAAALGGHYGDVPPLLDELLARDYVAYAGRLERDKELSALRASPQWSMLEDLESRYRQAWADGFGEGFFFVGRQKEAATPAADATRLSPHQEAYHYDPQSGRYRRLTDTDGRVYAIAVSPDRQQLAFLTVDKLGGGDKKAFIEPRAGVLPLGNLEAGKPVALPIKDPAAEVHIGFLHNDAAFAVDKSVWQFDSAHTGLVKTEAELSDVDVTKATPDGVFRIRQPAPGVELSDDKLTLTLEGVEEPVTAKRAVHMATVAWSPDKKLLTFAGESPACEFAAVGDSAPKENELYVFDADKKAAARVAHGASEFESAWLDDDHLLYEAGVGNKSSLHILEFPAKKDTPLKMKYGAGMFGVPSLACRPDTKDAPAEEKGEEGEEAAADDNAGDTDKAE